MPDNFLKLGKIMSLPGGGDVTAIRKKLLNLFKELR